MKKIAIFLTIAVIGFVITASTFVYNYTQNQVNDITDALIKSVENHDLKPIEGFGYLLYYHVHGIIDSDTSCRDSYWKRCLAGDATPQSYKNGIRRQIAKNPQMLYSALSLFGAQALDRFERGLINSQNQILNEGYHFKTYLPEKMEEIFGPDWWEDRFRKQSKDSNYAEYRRMHEAELNDSIEWTNRIENFSVSQFLCEQLKVMGKYDSLVNELLGLSDKNLNAFIAELGCEQVPGACTQEVFALNTHKWLVDKKLIQKMPVSNYNYSSDNGKQIWYLSMYPVDMLLFVYRINHDYPNWTPRKILTEIKTFSMAVRKLVSERACRPTLESVLHNKKTCKNEEEDCLEENVISFERKVSVTHAQQAAVYPNPTDGLIRVGFVEDGLLRKIKVLNSLGQSIHEVNTDKKIVEIDLGGLRSGMYLVSISGDNTAETHSIIKQ